MTRTAALAAPGKYAQVPLTQLELHPRNPRRDPGDVADLAASIKSQGILEPLIVTPAPAIPGADGRYLIVAGGRRFAAAKVAKLVEVPVIIRELDDTAAAAAALVENLQREDLDPIETARGYKDLLALTGWQQKDLATQLGIDPTTVSHALRLLEAPELVQKAVRDGRIGAEHARAVLGIPADRVSALPLKKGTTVEDLKAAAEQLTERIELEGRINAAQVEAAEKATKLGDGAVVTWGGDLVLPGAFDDRADATVRIEKVLGPAPKRIAGQLEGHQTYTIEGKGGYARYIYADGSVKVHGEACDCLAIAVVPRDRQYGAVTDVKVARVCVSPSGFAAYLAELQKADRKKSRGQRAAGATKADKLRAQRDRAREVLATVTDVLKVDAKRLDIPKSAGKVDRAGALAKLTRGGLEGEPLRLVVFALARSEVRYEDAALPVLWDRIKTMPRRELGRIAAGLAAEAAVRGGNFGKDPDVTARAILEHYKVVGPAPAAAAAKPAKKGGKK